MSDDLEKTISDLKEGYGSARQFRLLRQNLILRCRPDLLYETISAYVEKAPVLDWDAVLPYVRYKDDPAVSGVTIGASARRRCPVSSFWSDLIEVARGENWDPENDARIQAILSLHRLPGGCSDEAKEVIRSCLRDSSAAVRDSAAIAAQRCYGVCELDVISGGTRGRLHERLPVAIAEWLN